MQNSTCLHQPLGFFNIACNCVFCDSHLPGHCVHDCGKSCCGYRFGAAPGVGMAERVLRAEAAGPFQQHGFLGIFSRWTVHSDWRGGWESK